jgi:exosortase
MPTKFKRDQRSAHQPAVWATTFAAVLLAGIGIWAYWPTIRGILSAWSQDPDYSHGFLVVPLALLFLWLRRFERPQIAIGFHSVGLVVLMMAGLMRYLAGRLYLPELDAWSLPLWICGTSWTVFGRKVVRWALPSIAFLWFATPLPATIGIALSTPLQLFAAKLSGIVLQLFGQPAVVEGTTILLGDKTLEVERACSGLRMFYGITALAFAIILLTRPGTKKSICVLLAIAPVAIFVNVVRIAATGLLIEHSSSALFQHLTHDLAGVIVIPLALFLFLGVLWIIQQTTRRWDEDTQRTTRWLLGGFAFGLLMMVAGGWWYGRQADNAFATLLQTADRFEHDGDPRKALEYLDRYTRVRPDDLAQRVRLAVTYAKFAETSGDKLRAAELLRNAFQAEPKRRDLAFQAVDLASQTESYTMALELLGEFESSDGGKSDDAIIEKRADVLFAYLSSPVGVRQNDFMWSDVATALERSIERKNYPARHAAALAVVTRQHLIKPDKKARAIRADELINQLVVDRADDPEAWLNRYRYGKLYWAGNEAYDSDADLDRALEHRIAAPPTEQVEILLAAAERSFRRDPSGAGACSFLEQAIEALPTAVRPYLALADIHRQAEDVAGRQAAISALRRGVLATNDAPELVIALAQGLAANGNDAEADHLLIPLQMVLSEIGDGPTRGYLKLGIATVKSIEANRQGRPAEAAQLLKSVLGSADVALAAESRYTDSVEQSWRQLAEYYAFLDCQDQALAASRQALRLSPNSTAARNVFIEAALAAGDFEVAIAECRGHVQLDTGSGDAWLALAAAELRQQLQLPPDRRDLSDAQRSLAQAQKLVAAKVPLLLTSVELLRAKNRPSQAKQLLEKSLHENPDQPLLWQSLAITRMEERDPVAALDAVNELEAHGGRESSVKALRANILVDSGHEEEAVKLLEEAQETLNGRDQCEVTLLAAALQRKLGNNADARSTLDRARRQHPTNLAPLERLAQYAAADHDWKQLARWEDELRKLEGAVGTHWKSYRVTRLLATAGQLDRVQLAEITNLAKDVVEARPRWPTGYYLMAQTALLRGDNDEAIRQLEAGWELGLRDAAAAEQLLMLLTAAGRTPEIERYGSEMGNLSLASPRMFDQLILVLVRSGRGEQAVSQARQWVHENPSDTHAFVRFGRACLLYSQTLDAGSKDRDSYRENAEKAFLEAIRRAPSDEASWSSLITFYVQTQRPQEANELLDRFEREAELRPVEKQIVLAQSNALLSHTAAAVRNWRRAVDLAQQQSDVALRVATLSEAATYFATSSPKTAERYCRLAMAADASAVVPRLILVRLLGSREESPATAEALTILDSISADEPKLAAEKRRLTARLLANRNNAGDVARAIELLNGLKVQTTEDKLLLAELYSQIGRPAIAYDLLDGIVSSQSARADELAAFLVFWQKNFQADGRFGNRTQEVLTRLGQLPQGLHEQLRWEIRLAKTSPQAPGELNISQILERLWKLPAAMQSWQNEQTGQAMLYSILRVLLDEGCVEAAEQVCRHPPGKMTPQFAARLLANTIMMHGADDESQVAAGEELLDEQLATFPNDVQLLQDAGDLASVAGHNDRAVAMYERVLAIDPNHQAARNNLATIWSTDVARRQAALESIRQTIAEHPESGSLLNTEGQILLQLDRTTEAVELLTAAAEKTTDSPSVYLNLAVAQDQLDCRPAAEEALIVAVTLAVEGRPLSPEDRQALTELRSKYKL